MLIKSTKNYDQFKMILGNREIEIPHVNKLIKLNAVNNLLWQFPGQVTKDGYVWDGQHRLAAAKSQDWDFYYTQSDKTLAEMGDNIVPVTNTAQMRWKTIDYINWYAKHGNAQYIFLLELMNEFHISDSIILSILKGTSFGPEMRLGKLGLYTSSEEKDTCLELINAYFSLKEIVPSRVFSDSKHARAIRVMFKYVSVEDIKQALERAPMQLVAVRDDKDYLRQYEDIFNYKRSEAKYVRFFGSTR